MVASLARSKRCSYDRGMHSSSLLPGFDDRVLTTLIDDFDSR